MVEMDQRITLQVPTLTSDGGGGQTATWGNIPSTPVVWARVRPLRGDEDMEDGRMDAVGLTEFTIRNRTDITERMRIVWQSENYNIRRIFRRGPRPLYVTIEAERGAADI